MYFFSRISKAAYIQYSGKKTRASSGAKHKGMDFVCLGRNGWMDEDEKKKKKNESNIIVCRNIKCVLVLLFYFPLHCAIIKIGNKDCKCKWKFFSSSSFFCLKNCLTPFANAIKGR